MDQTEKTVTIQQHPEEEAHHENGASKMFRKVKARAKKFKISITKHGESHEHDDHDVVEEDNEDDELEPEVIGVPVTDQPESLSQPKEANVSAPEKIVPPGTKVFPVESSDYTKPIEPVPLQDTYYGHEVLSDPVRTTDTSDKEQRREELMNRDESREAHHEPMDTHVSLLSATEDVTSTFAPGGEDEDLGGQRKVNVETPKTLEEDSVTSAGGSDYLNGVSNYQSKVNDLTYEGGEAEVPEIAESLGRLKVTDESSDQKSGFEKDLPTRSHEVDRETESDIGNDSPVRFGGKSGAEMEKDFSTRSHEFDMTTESGIDENSPSRSHEFDLKTESAVNKNSPMGFGSESKTGFEEDSPRRSYESDHKTESENVKNSPTGFDGELGAKLGEDSPTRSCESDQKTETEINKNSPTGFGSASIVGIGEDFPAESHELGLKNESGSGKDSPTGYGGESGTILGEDFPAKVRHGYGEESEARRENNFPARSDDVKVETELGRDLPTETHDQFSPELSRPKERDDFEESRDSFEETRDETQKPKQSIYTEQFASGGDETQVAGNFDEKSTSDKETGSTVTPELPLSGSGINLEEKQQGEVEKCVSAKDYLSDKLTPGEEDKALSNMIAEKLHLGGGEKKTTTKEVEVPVEKIPSEKEPEEKEHGEAVAEETKGEGMVGMIKGWFGGGATEEGKPKSPHSAEESSQSLGSTVGTMGFSDSGRSELRETGGGGSGVVPVRRELGN